MGVDAYDRMMTSTISKSTVGGKNFTGFRYTMAPLKASLANKAPMTELVEVYRHSSQKSTRAILDQSNTSSRPSHRRTCRASDLTTGSAPKAAALPSDRDRASAPPLTIIHLPHDPSGCGYVS
jgi:hypothetical protein